jgi:hypothetical protein
MMGNYRVEIEAVGGHGCQREVKEGSVVYGCGRRDCPDCAAREFVAELKRKGNSMVHARLIHWPGTPTEVQDDLLTGIRKGNF